MGIDYRTTTDINHRSISQEHIKASIEGKTSQELFNEQMKTNFLNVSQTGQDFKRRLEYKEIKITGKDIEDSKKEF